MKQLVPSPVAGVVKEYKVQPGDRVSAGQVVAIDIKMISVRTALSQPPRDCAMILPTMPIALQAAVIFSFITSLLR